MPKPVRIDRVAHSKHFRERKEKIRYIIIHCSAHDTDSMLQILDERGLSVHYIISERGKVTENLPPEKVAFHAGESKWKGSRTKSLNDCSIGIELESMGMGQRPEDYSMAQLRKLYSMLHWLMHKYKIRKDDILGHSDVAPTRKPDPGAGFPWNKLYKHDISFWYKRSYHHAQNNEAKLLQIIGYDTKNLIAARYAFCRRFLPKEVIVEENAHKVIEEPFPKDFCPKDWDEYMLILKATATASEKESRHTYWFLK